VAFVFAIANIRHHVVWSMFDLPCNNKPTACVGGYLAMGYGYSRFAGPQTLRKVVLENSNDDPAFVTVREVLLGVKGGGAFVYPNDGTQEQWLLAHPQHKAAVSR
jgi:hypothetical protein